MTSGRERAEDVTSARALAAEVARRSYGQLLAILATPSGDIQLAEDGLADPFARALEVWPEAGAPANPEGWLLTVAHNRVRDIRRLAVNRTSFPLDGVEPPPEEFDDLDPDAVPDRRLEHLFVCAHPAIDPTIRSPHAPDM